MRVRIREGGEGYIDLHTVKIVAGGRLPKPVRILFPRILHETECNKYGLSKDKFGLLRLQAASHWQLIAYQLTGSLRSATRYHASVALYCFSWRGWGRVVDGVALKRACHAGLPARHSKCSPLPHLQKTTEKACLAYKNGKYIHETTLA